MILKWAIGGAIVGVVIALNTNDSVAALAFVGAAVGVIFRKWVLRTFWS